MLELQEFRDGEREIVEGRVVVVIEAKPFWILKREVFDQAAVSDGWQVLGVTQSHTTVFELGHAVESSASFLVHELADSEDLARSPRDCADAGDFVRIFVRKEESEDHLLELWSKTQ